MLRKLLLSIFAIAISFCGQLSADVCNDFTIGPNSANNLEWDAPDDGAVDEATEEWTLSHTDASGNFSYDVTLTISTDDASGALNLASNDLNVRAGETHTFSIAVSNFVDLSGTGNFSLGSFTYTDVILDAAGVGTDEGTFTANGIVGNWDDYNSNVSGENFQGEPLSLIGPQSSTAGSLNPFDGSDVVSFTHERTGTSGHRFEDVGFRVKVSEAAVPEPGSLSLLAMMSMFAVGRRRRS